MHKLPILLLLAALGLGACENMVVIKEPVLTPADATTEMMIKPGLWVLAVPPDVTCPFQPVRSVRNWPDCAEVHLVEEAQFSRAFEMMVEGRDWISAEVDPGLFVIQTVTRELEPDYDLSFFVREKQDASGAATRVGIGWLFCGPPAPDGTRWPDGQTRTLTLEPYPGAIIEGSRCRPNGKAGLFALTRANREAGLVSSLTWLRSARADEIGFLRRRKAKEKAAEAARKKFEAQSTIAE